MNANTKVIINPLVKSVIGTMSDPDQFEIQCLLRSIKTHPELGRQVECQPGRLYQKTHGVTKRRYPHGLRIIYQCFYKDEIHIIAIEDMGDHRSCCSNPGHSVYFDERE